MPYYATSQEWLRQSALLLEARPTTTRITTKYSITKPKARKSKTTTTTTTSSSESSITKPPRGNITIKTFDPSSGVTLKYKTTKAAEVGRLIGCLGRLGTRMTGLPGDAADLEVVAVGATGGAAAPAGAEDVVMEESAAPSGVATPAVAEPVQKAGGGGGKGKKKKGKK